MYDRKRDIDRRTMYLLAAELKNLQDIFLARARALAQVQPEEVSPQDAAVAGFAEARAEYQAFGESSSPELPSA